MGWGSTRVSSGETDFNYDHHASFTPQQRERYGGLRRLVGRPRHATRIATLSMLALLSEPTFPGVPDPVAGHLHVADYRSEGPRRQVAVLVSIGHVLGTDLA